MTRATSELAHYVRQLKAPAAARAIPKLAHRARAEAMDLEKFAAALLKTGTESRDSHGGQAHVKAARFPARKTLEDFDFAFRPHCAAERSCTSASSLSRRPRERRPARPPGTGKTHVAIAIGIRARLAGHRVAFKIATE